VSQPNKPYTWSMDEQFKKHDPKKESALKYKSEIVHSDDIEALTPNGKVMATNPWGRPEGLFLYGNDRTTQLEFACDLDMTKLKNAQGIMEIKITGMHLLCPKCGSPLHINGAGIPGGQEIVVHWNKMVRSNTDGKYRPLVSVDGALGCDYSDADISGVQQSRSGANVIMRCNWRGGIIEGRCFDHSIRSVKG